MTRAPLYDQLVRVRLNAPSSAYHGHIGSVDAHDLDESGRRDSTITLRLDDGRSTIAYADELEIVEATHHTDGADNRAPRSSEASR